VAHRQGLRQAQPEQLDVVQRFSNRTLISDNADTNRAATKESNKTSENSAGRVLHGQIVISVRPWGHVSIDGKLIGTVPPRLVLNASEGNHTVMISNESNEVLVLDVEVKGGKRMQISHDFLAETSPAILGSIAIDKQHW
jgi:DNA/RNA endonuclease YhcR with UshA esterase domain